MHGPIRAPRKTVEDCLPTEDSLIAYIDNYATELRSIFVILSPGLT